MITDPLSIGTAIRVTGTSKLEGVRENLEKEITTALCQNKLIAASEAAERLCRLNRQSHWYPSEVPSDYLSLPWPTPQLSRGKLRHDLEQLEYLRIAGRLPSSLLRRISDLQAVLKLLGSNFSSRRPLTSVEREMIGDIYGRLIIKAIAPRQSCALSSHWNRDRVQQAYLDHPIGIVVIDDFLTPDALASLRRFCVESTIWFENRYSYGRLGAFFRDGFNCPLLIQIAEELPAAIPRIIKRNPLQQLWAFKNEPFQPVTLPHADFAMVNVNFWLTPNEANEDSRSGGMVIYDVPTPADWDFQMYNTKGGLIASYLQQKQARALTIPYRANRAIIFNSRYFHKTDRLNFAERYESRRINVTLLYGRHDFR